MESCQYEEPDDYSGCISSVSGISARAASSSAKVRGAVVDGRRSLVAVTGRLCLEGHGCRSNSNVNTGMPVGRVSFDADWEAESSASTGHLSTIRAVKIRGQWYTGT